MFRALILISFFICSAHSATTEIKQTPVKLAVTDIKQPPLQVVVANTLWTDIGLREPTALIKVEYKNSGKVTTVTAGATVEKIITGPAPKLFWQLEKNAKYTVAMIDPDAPSRKEPTKRSVSVKSPLWVVINTHPIIYFFSTVAPLVVGEPR